MAHITSSESSERNPSRPGKFASSAIEALIQNMERSGASRSRLTASIVGGAEISVRAEDEPDTLILDAGVCRAVELELRRHEIPLSFQEIGGKCDRSVVFDVSRGSVIVKAVDQATWYSMISQPLEKVAA